MIIDWAKQESAGWAGTRRARRRRPAPGFHARCRYTRVPRGSPQHSDARLPRTQLRFVSCRNSQLTAGL